VFRDQQADNDFFTPWIPPPILVKALPYTSRARDPTTSLKNIQNTRRWRHSRAEKGVPKKDDGTEEEDEAHRPGSHQNKEEMLALVDQVQQGTVATYMNFQRDPFMRGYAPAEGPDVTVSERLEDKHFPGSDEVRGIDDPTQALIAKLWRAINRRLVNPYKTNIGYIYDLYQQLPGRRITHLHWRIRHRLLKVMGREQKNQKSMLRYFAIVADVQEAGLRLTLPEWNAAVSFAARWVGHSQDKENKAALQMWKEMETDAGVKSNAVTFNILFDVASKAGNFVLAEKIYREMGKRNLPWNRYHHVSLIHFFGLKQDSDGIRAAYREMVEAGELIDTVVLNCVMSGFLRCGEEDAADRVYERMKTAHESAPSMPYRNQMSDSVITKVLMMFAKIGQEADGKHPDQQWKDDARMDLGGGSGGGHSGAKTGLGAVENIQDVVQATRKDLGAEDDAQSSKPETDGAETSVKGKGDGGALRRHFQRQSPIVPDLQTYRIFLNHYAVRVSALDKVFCYLEDMKWFQIPIHGAIFLALFKGFALYGGPGQQWSRARLNTVYDAFRAALAENANGMYMDIWMAKWILRAFRRCDTEDRLWEVWAEIKPRCESDFEQGDFDKFEEFLVRLMHPDRRHQRYSDMGMFGEVDPGRWGRGAWLGE